MALLRWSPCGSYLLAGGAGGGFRIWQTQTWWSAAWTAAEGGAGRLVDACWGPDSRTLLLAYDASPQARAMGLCSEAGAEARFAACLA